MRDKLILEIKDMPHIYLQSISEDDIEDMRVWKNRFKEHFFNNTIIASDQQKRWYKEYLKRSNDFMFIVKEKLDMAKNRSIGCMGFRFDNGNQIDIYNIIRGVNSNKEIKMGDALKIMLSYIAKIYNADKIKCDVLEYNPALNWYLQCGFVKKGFDILNDKKYYIMEIESQQFLDNNIIIRRLNYD